MAMTQQQRDERRRTKAKRLQEEDLRLKVRPGTKQALAELMQWAGIKEQGEALTLMIHHVQGRGRAGVIRLLTCSLHKMEHQGNVVPISQAHELRMKARPGTLRALDALLAWTGAACYGGAVDLIVDCLHQRGPQQARPFMKLPPRAKYMIPAHVAAKLQLAYNREALRICHDE